MYRSSMYTYHLDQCSVKFQSVRNSRLRTIGSLLTQVGKQASSYLQHDIAGKFGVHQMPLLLSDRGNILTLYGADI